MTGLGREQVTPVLVLPAAVVAMKGVSDAAARTGLRAFLACVMQGDNHAPEQCGGPRLGNKGAAELGPSHVLTEKRRHGVCGTLVMVLDGTPHQGRGPCLCLCPWFPPPKAGPTGMHLAAVLWSKLWGQL